MSQLTITLDDDLLQAAQAYARQHGQELDALLTQLLADAVRPALATAAAQHHFSPEIQELVGSLRLPADFDYKKELEEALREKYGL